MFIKTIKLKHFRNYSEALIDLEKGVNIFYGENAQGKTNIIESVYFASMGKSHRGSKDSEIIQWTEHFAKISIYFEKEEIDRKIEVDFKEDLRKQIKINGLKIGKTSELLGTLNSVIFSPDHMKIIKDGPAERRRFIDIILSQTSKKYFYYLTQYNKVMEQRNKLLISIKKEGLNELNLDVWDNQLVEFGTLLISLREEFVIKINEFSKKIHESITNGLEVLELKYVPSTTVKNMEEDIKHYRKIDILRGFTSKGPHRDEINFYINEKEVKIFGSQGQQRTSLLSLKLAELQYIYHKTGEYPILLLDDVFSELDTGRQNYLIKYIKDIQTIITCTDVGYFKNFDVNSYNILKVNKGIIEKDKPC